MRLLKSIAELREARAAAPGSVGLVPTMGCLHEGHLSLVRLARAKSDTVVVSIFVNPTQFGPGEDFERYPRTMEADLAALEQEGVDLVFAPPVHEIYPDDFDSVVEVGSLTRRLEGEARPGHFRGVTTVVAKLINLVQPDRMYMGEKDGQQLRVLRKMVKDLNFAVEVVGAPTIREADGLALSSRNRYLTPEERRAATVIPRALAAARERFGAGERDARSLCEVVRAQLSAEPLAQIGYISLADSETLEDLERVDGRAMLSVAVQIGSTRLIDNIVLEPGA
ncbi:MAG: pantoate--beta-alanine ligase [Anaerolineae bacterium]|nr:pantoate--beta-alanine ligase [Anaerolineae bacterium]